MQVNDRIKEIRTVKASEILPNPKNWRTHPEEQKNAMMGAFAEIGNIDVLKCVETEKGLMLIDGHLRTDILGDNEIKVAVLDLTVDEANKALATFDPIAMSAKADEEKLSSLLSEIEFESNAIDDMLEGLDLTTGFGGVKDGLTDPDEVPEVPEEPVVKPGELWLLGDHRLLCGDSTKAEDVERLMGGEKADLWLTDPPYNVALGMNETPEEAKRRNRRTDKKVVENDHMSDSDFREFLKECFSVAFESCKPGASFYIWHADSEGYNFRGSIIENGQKIRQCLIWRKSSLCMGRQDYQWMHEPCLYGWKDGASHGWYSDRKQTTILEYDKPSQSKEHPTMKPVALFSYQIGNSTANQDIVFDSFLGSGTTLIAAEQLNRKCYGMEISPQYCDVIIKRWEDFTGNKAELAK